MTIPAVTNHLRGACNCCDNFPFQDITTRTIRRQRVYFLNSQNSFAGFAPIEGCGNTFSRRVGKTRIWTRSNTGTQTISYSLSGGTNLNASGACGTPAIENITELTIGSAQTVTSPPNWTSFTSIGAGATGTPTITETSITYGPRSDGNVDTVTVSDLWTQQELYQAALSDGPYGGVNSSNWVADLLTTLVVGNGLSDGFAGGFSPLFTVVRTTAGGVSNTITLLRSQKIGIRFSPPITCYLKVWYTLETALAIKGIIVSVEECDFGILEFKDNTATFSSDHFNLTKTVFEGGNTCRGAIPSVVDFLTPQEGIEIFPKIPQDEIDCDFTIESRFRIKKWSYIEGYEPVFEEVEEFLGGPNVIFKRSTTKNGNPLGDVS